MKYYIEIWNAKPTWMALSTQARADYMNLLGPAIQSLMDQGVEIIAWGLNDSATLLQGSFAYYAIWKFPSPEPMVQFEAMVQQSGWYDYFDQINIAGTGTSPQEIIGHMIGL